MVNTHKRGFAATFHQRHAGSITVALIEQVIDFLHQHYDAVWLSVSEETVPELKEAIRSNQQCTAITREYVLYPRTNCKGICESSANVAKNGALDQRDRS